VAGRARRWQSGQTAVGHCTMQVKVSWNKQLYEVDVDMEQPPLVFKTQLFTLTGVPPERQKIMVKGGALKDDEDWSKLKLKEGQKLMMIGTAGELPKAPEKETVFAEDLPQAEQVDPLAAEFSAGLVNLGNTCYMASTVQCLAVVPELSAALGTYDASSSSAADPTAHKLSVATRDLMQEMRRNRGKSVAPFRMLANMRERFPQFGELGENGVPMQQDAEECWTLLLQTYAVALRSPSSPTPLKDAFAIDFQSMLRCTESDETKEETETEWTIKCHITQETAHLSTGLKSSLSGNVEKVSEALGRSVMWTKETRISRLPTCLTVQFVRFFYKVQQQKKAKILKAVAYPLTLDMYDFCTDALKAELDKGRKAEQLAADKAAARGGASEEASNGDAEKKRKAEGEAAPEAASAQAMDVDQAPAAAPPPATTEAQERLPSGKYELCGVLTHKGRSADGGHYVAWVKTESGQWVKFDDEVVTPVKEEEILRLSGGGDWHMAYLVLYRQVLF